MSGWNDAARQREWSRQGAGRVRGASVGRWSPLEILFLVLAFLLRWEIGLAFLGLKLWHQASGAGGSVFAFARVKWEGLVSLVQGAVGGRPLPFSVHFGQGSSGNHAFDAWRRAELARIEAERAKLRTAERDFAGYHDELLQAKDREDFERFMRARQVN